MHGTSSTSHATVAPSAGSQTHGLAASPARPGSLPLAGIRVLDLSRLLPGPYCSLLLADLGADVIKIETPTAGDYARMAPAELGFGGIFDAVNRGKRSLAVNYRLPRGRDVVLRLAANADVFLEASRPGQMTRRGLGPDDVHAVAPGIVYCSLSGYGQTGPYRDRPGHDLDYLALSGLLSLMGPRGARPTPPGLQVADIAGGTLAALEIVAALVRQAQTGAGATLDVAVLDAIVSWLAPLGAGIARAASDGGPLGGTFPCYTVYQAGDGVWLAVGALEPQFWVSFCRGLGREDLVPRQYDPTAIGVVAGCLSARAADEWLELLDDDACVARVNLPVEAEADPQVRVRGIVVGEGDQTRIVTPLRAAAHDVPALPAPGHGPRGHARPGDGIGHRWPGDPGASGARDPAGIDARQDGRARTGGRGTGARWDRRVGVTS
jgi:alpha-methylacyl-CoA racemase